MPKPDKSSKSNKKDKKNKDSKKKGGSSGPDSYNGYDAFPGDAVGNSYGVDSNPYNHGAPNFNGENFPPVNTQSFYRQAAAPPAHVTDDLVTMKLNEIASRESRLHERIKRIEDMEALNDNKPPNWPICYPIMYLNISDIRERDQKINCYIAYYLWIVTIALNILNAFCMVTIFWETYNILTSNYVSPIMAVVYMFLYPPIMFYVWFRCIYNGARGRNAFMYLLFLLAHVVHCLFIFMMLLGFQYTGSAGAIQVLTFMQSTGDFSFGSSSDSGESNPVSKIILGFLFLNIVGWFVNGVFSAYLMVVIFLYFRKKQMAIKAKQQMAEMSVDFATGVANNPNVRNAAGMVAREGLKATASAM